MRSNSVILFTVVLVPGLAGTLQACAPAVVAGAATAATAAHDRRTLGAFVDDQTIELKARQSILSDETLRGKVHTSVTSINGIVLLTGESPTAQQRDQILARVRPVQGIRRIINEVRVAEPSTFGSRSNDTWLTSKVKTKMLGTKGLDPTRVKVVTENAVVYLMGLVNRREADLATESARSVKGIQRVVKLFEYID